MGGDYSGFEYDGDDYFRAYDSDNNGAWYARYDEAADCYAGYSDLDPSYLAAVRPIVTAPSAMLPDLTAWERELASPDYYNTFLSLVIGR